MHGKKRVKTTEEIAKHKKQEELKKIEGYCKIVQIAMDMYKSNVLTDDGLKASGKVLDLNPEFYTLWNYRRKIFLHMQEQGQTEELQSKLASELKFIEGGIRNHPKSYWLFHHRLWVTSHQSSPNWQYELMLTTEMLKADERNFHCWGYRRYITTQSSTPASSEFQFTTKKIEENFSNYSAWHQRSKLIPQLYPTSQELEPVLEEEFELIQNAFYTEPKDSSAWFYYRWLISQLDNLDKQKSREILEKELGKLTEFQNFLAESETGPDALIMQKYPLQTRTVIMMKLGGHEKEIADNLKTLVKSDPDRRNYYIDMAQTLLPSQVVEDVAKLVQELKVC